MPILPAHIGLAILIGSIAGKKLNLPVLIISSLIIDIEVTYWAILTGRSIHHGYFHTYEGGALFGFLFGTLFFILMIIVWKIRDAQYKEIDIYNQFRGFQKHNWTYSYKCIIISSILGVYSHIPLDWVFYESDYIRPFSFADHNYFLHWEIFHLVYFFCIGSFILGLILFYYRSKTNKNRSYEISSIYDIKLHFRYIWAVIAIMLTPFGILGVIYAFSLVHPRVLLSTINNYQLIIFYFICLVIMVFCYSKALKSADWKLFE